MIQVIAEIGSSWCGDRELGKNLIRLSKEAGCFATKMQFWKAHKLYPGRAREFSKFELTSYEAGELSEYAREIGIPWFCSVWDPVDVNELERFGVFAYKLSTNRGIDFALFERVAQTRKPVIISVVPKLWGVRESLVNDFGFEKEKVKLLYVVPKYPCTMDDIDWERLKDPHISGYSNHVPDPVACIVAYKKGARVIETHVKLDEATLSPDASCSLTMAQFSDLMGFFRKEEGE